jgi:hypothetical protein
VEYCQYRFALPHNAYKLFIYINIRESLVEQRAFYPTFVPSEGAAGQAHELVAFLGYALWVTRKASAEASAYPYNTQPISPKKALALLSTLQSANIVLPTTDGREIRLRRVTEPTAEQKSMLRQLGLSLPERLKSL